jgi:serpin B
MGKPTRILVLSSVAASCSSDETGDGTAPAGVQLAKSALVHDTQPSGAHDSDLGASNRAFAFDLFHHMAPDNVGQNMILSPYSVSTALAMAYAGARGQTATEMQTALHFDLAESDLHDAFNSTGLGIGARGKGLLGADGTPFRIHVQNALWKPRDHAVKPAFLDTLALN